MLRGSAIPPGKTSTACWPISANWSPDDKPVHLKSHSDKRGDRCTATESGSVMGQCTKPASRVRAGVVWFGRTSCDGTPAKTKRGDSVQLHIKQLSCQTQKGFSTSDF